MPVRTRKETEALYKLTKAFIFDDQESYYESMVERYNQSGVQVNGLRAFFSLLTGLAAAAAGLIVQATFSEGKECALAGSNYCNVMGTLIFVFTIIAVIAPAVSTAFGTLADLYQWDRFVSVYQSAEENLGVADAQAPDPDMDDMTYHASFEAYVEGMLSVMEDETAQWGQLAQTPPETEDFLEKERAKATAAETTPYSKPPATGGQSAPPGTLIERCRCTLSQCYVCSAWRSSASAISTADQ